MLKMVLGRIQKQYFWQEEVENYYKDVDIPGPKKASDKQFNVLPKEVSEDLIEHVGIGDMIPLKRYQESLKGYYRMISGVDNELGKNKKDAQSKRN